MSMGYQARRVQVNGMMPKTDWARTRTDKYVWMGSDRQASYATRDAERCRPKLSLMLGDAPKGIDCIHNLQQDQNKTSPPSSQRRLARQTRSSELWNTLSRSISGGGDATCGVSCPATVIPHLECIFRSPHRSVTSAMSPTAQRIEACT